jgi:hypothetical protein
MALAYYARMRFVVNLLENIRAAPTLRRVVTCFVGTKEGAVDITDIPGMRVSFLAMRSHSASVATIGLEAVATGAPDVTFIHNFPGAVNTRMLDGVDGIVPAIFRLFFRAFGQFVTMSAEEAGERHVFLLTSARYPAKEQAAGTRQGVAIPGDEELGVVAGTSGKIGEGVYSLEGDGEAAGLKVERVLAQLREDGTAKKVWDHTVGEWIRITGAGSLQQPK